MIRFGILLVVATLVTGCSWFGSDDKSDPPTPLESFDRSVKLKEVWSRDSGAGTDEQFLKLVPAIFDQQVFVADRNGDVFSFALGDGKKRWKAGTDAAISAGAGVGEGLVVVGTSDGQIIALAMEDGVERWRVRVSSEVLSVPQIVEDIVLVQTVDGNLVGLNAADGTRKWIHDRIVPVLTLRGTSTPLIIDTVAIAGFSSGKIVALDIKTGRQLWDIPVAVPHGRSELQRIVDIDDTVVIRNGILYVSSYQGRMVAIDMETGEILWNRDMSSYAGVAVDRSQVYVTDAESYVWALDRRNGASLWKQDKLLRRKVTGPVVINEWIGVGDYEGYVHLLSVKNGEIVGRVRVDSDGIAAAPLVINGRLLVLGSGGELVLYELEPVDS